MKSFHDFKTFKKLENVEENDKLVHNTKIRIAIQSA